MRRRTYDMVVSGGGIVGAALACRVAGSSSPMMRDRTIACVEARKPRSFVDSSTAVMPDVRTYALAPASVRLLDQVGVWDIVLSSGRYQPFNHMQIWDATGSDHGYVRFSREDDLGYVVENNVLQSALYERMEALVDEGRMDLYCPDVVDRIEPEEVGGFYISTSGDKAPIELYTNLLVGADGGNSNIRRMSGLGTWGWSYEQKAVVATVRLDEGLSELDSGLCFQDDDDRSRTAWQRFLPSGPVAMLPLWDNMASIVWSTSVTEASKLQKLTPAQFVDSLNAAFQRTSIAGNLGRPDDIPFGLPGIPMLPFMAPLPDFERCPIVTEQIGSLASFPLQMSQATTYAKPGLALVGDAAHTIHPMAGQGLNYGLGDVQLLADLLDRACEVGGNFGDHNVLQQYEQERKQANAAMGASLEIIKRIFEADALPLRVARTAGMAALNANPFLKEQITKYAMGL